MVLVIFTEVLIASILYNSSSSWNKFFDKNKKEMTFPYV